MPSYLLRVQLEDRPGSLGALAMALGSAGADILSLDVVDRGSGYATDDLVVELPAESPPDVLITAAERLGGVRVDSVRPHTGLLDAHRELELIEHVAAEHGKHAKLQVLVDEAPRVLRVGWCAVVRGAEGSTAGSATSFHRIVGSPGAPETDPDSAPWLPIEHAAVLDGAASWVPPVWQDLGTTLVAAPLGDPDTAILLGRPGGPEFRPAEAVRLGYLSEIVATLLR